MMENHQRRIQIALPSLKRYFAQLRKTLRLPKEAATVWFVDDAQMSRWNRMYRGKGRTTDVLSFPVGAKRTGRLRMRAGADRREADGGSNGYLGDIAISPAVAKRNAARFGRTLPEELRILVLHGVLHLMGYDHETDNGEMERKEHRLRAKLGLS
jgi:probable rRNA maturation factor